MTSGVGTQSNVGAVVQDAVGYRPNHADIEAAASTMVAAEAHEDKVWIDYEAYPHIVHAITSYLDEPELKVFRRVSRSCCKAVDALLSTHLILSGKLYSNFPQTSSTAALHNRLWPMVGDIQRYHVKSDMPFGFSVDIGVLKEVAIPEFTRTRVLDIQGTVPTTVVAGLTPKMPNVHTIRIYDEEVPEEYLRISDRQRTLLYRRRSEAEAAQADDDASLGQMPAPPSARRLVNFTTLIPAHQDKVALAPYVLPALEELVVNITYNPAVDVVTLVEELAPLPSPPKRATIIFNPSPKADISDSDRKYAADNTFPDPFARSLGFIGAPTTIVGLEGVVQCPALVQGKRYDEMVALLRTATTEALTFVSLPEFRASVDDATWSLFTRPEPPKPQMVQTKRWPAGDIVPSTSRIEFMCRRMWGPGTAILGRIGDDWTFRYPATPSSSTRTGRQLPATPSSSTRTGRQLPGVGP